MKILPCLTPCHISHCLPLTPSPTLLAGPGHGLSACGQNFLAHQGCSASDVPCNGKWILSDGVCCPDGNYCNPGWLCWPQDSGCCKSGWVVWGIGCCDGNGKLLRSGRAMHYNKRRRGQVLSDHTDL